MIVDCHTYIWESAEQLGRAASLWDGRGHNRGSAKALKASPADHLAAGKPVDQSFVLAFRSRRLQADIPNAYVAAYVRKHPGRLIGLACVDPNSPAEAISELRRARDELGLKGLAISPPAQEFHPASSGAMRVYGEAQRLRLPVMIHTGLGAIDGRLEFARPALLDEVAREYPDLKIVVSHLGYPWVEETVVLLAKHREVYADISGLLNHPWLAYNALLSAYQANVMDALFFGSNFPFSSPAVCIEALYSINQFCHGTNLPNIPREQLRQIVERPALEALGIESPQAAPVREPDTTVIRMEE